MVVLGIDFLFLFLFSSICWNGQLFLCKAASHALYRPSTARESKQTNICMYTYTLIQAYLPSCAIRPCHRIIISEECPTFLIYPRSFLYISIGARHRINHLIVILDKRISRKRRDRKICRVTRPAATNISICAQKRRPSMRLPPLFLSIHLLCCFTWSSVPVRPERSMFDCLMSCWASVS